MKKFTRLLFTLVLLCAVGVMNAQEKVYATFANPTGIAWDAGNSTFSWSAPWGNQLHNIGLPNGNITEYEKVVVDCTILEGDSYRIMFYGNDFGTTAGGITVINQSGKKEYVLADFAMDPGYLTNCSEFCLSGNGASGKVKVNEVYFVKPADPVKLAKGILQKTITAAQTVDGSIYTTDSYDKLKTALAAAQAALNATSVEPVDAANAALTTAINALVYKIGVSDLTKDLFINHDNNQPAGCYYVLNVADGLPYGDGNVFWKNYADLSEYSKLIVTVSAGVPRFCFNRTEDQAQYSGDPKNPKFFSIPNQEFAAEVYQKVSGNVYTIDIAKIVADYGFAYLHCIKGYNGNVTVTGMYLLKVVEGAKDEEDVSGALAELRQAIAQAETVNTESASEYRQGVFSKTLSEAQILVAIAEAGDATVGWIRTMMARIDNAVNMLYVEDPEVIPYEYTPEPVTYKGVKKDLKAAVDAAEATLDANQNKPEALQNALATLIDQGNTILANDYSKMDQEEFEEMVNTVINRIKAAEEALKNAKEATEEPEPVIANGTYYIYNAATGLYLGAGDSWGTHAVVNKNGLDYQVTSVNGKYTLNSQVSNGGQNYFLNGEWNDGGSYEWTIQETAPGSGIYTLSNGSQFAVAKGSTNNAIVQLQADGSSAEAQWQFITPEQRLAKAQEQFATASEENPVDLSFLIKDGDFGRNDLRKSYWNVTFNDSWGFNISGGNNNNNNAECYHHVFAIQQSVQVPDGKYMLKAQGFYRQDGGDNVNLPVFYANDETRVFPLKTTSENSMSDASVSFSAGKFEIEPIILDVVGGELSIGCKLDNNTNLWCIWDNFRLYYIGTASADLYEPAYYALLDEAKSIYEGNKNTMGAKTKSALENAINKEVNVENTSELIAGIDALKAAIAAAKEEIAANEAQMKALAAELKKAIDNAEALYNIEAYQVNRESFGELIAAAKQILDKNANTVNTYVYYIDELKDASAKFMAANKPVVEPGKVFIKNVASGKWLGAGNNWGTQASLNEHPDYVTLVMPSGLYNIESQVSNGGQSYYFRDQDGLFMDQTPATNLTIEKKDGNYLISSEKGFYGYDGTSVLAGGLAATDANAQWQIYSEKDMNDMLNAASVAEPVDATWLITDAKFGRNNRNVEAWQVGGNCTNKALTGGNSNKYGAESFHSTFDIYQSLNVPNGVYAFTAQGFYRQDGSDNENLPVFYVNDETTTFPLKTGSENSMADAANSFDAGSYAIDPIYVEVTDGILRVGSRLENNTSIWAMWANYSLTYYGADASIDAVKNSSVFTDLAKLIKEGEALLDQVEVDKVKNALNKAIEAGKAAKSLDDCNAAMAALKEAVAAAEGSVKAKDVLPKMKELVEMNNIATAEALEEYYGQWVTKYQEGTITKAEASALQDPTVLTGWHASLTCDDYLLSAWDAEPDFQSPYYINTWSVEGDKDGTNFHVPFIEYWTGDDSSLGEKTMTAAIDGVPAGKYTVEAWVRVRMKNSGSAPTYGISMQANGSNPVDVCDGEESTDGSSTFFNKVYQIPVTIGADGALTVSFDIASDNNVSWLAIKNVRYFDPNATGIKTVGTQKAAGQIFNLQGQRVNKATKGVFIQDGKIILKK